MKILSFNGKEKEKRKKKKGKKTNYKKLILHLIVKPKSKMRRVTQGTPSFNCTNFNNQIH